MRIDETGITRYFITQSAPLLDVIKANKVVNRGYSYRNNVFSASSFSLSPETSGEKMLWGSPEKIDGTSDSNNGFCSVEDYGRYSPQSEMIDDDNIILGNTSTSVANNGNIPIINNTNIKGHDKRLPFFVNGYDNGKFVTNVIPGAYVSGVSKSVDGYIFNVTGLPTTEEYRLNRAWVIRFPNGLVANCVSVNGNSTSSQRSFSCYTLNDDYTINIIKRYESGTQEEKERLIDCYFKRVSIFPAVSYTTYVSPFYSEMNFEYIDNSETIDIDCSYNLSYYGTTPPDTYGIKVGIAMAYLPDVVGFNCVAVVSAITSNPPLPSEINTLTFSILNQNITVVKENDSWKQSGSLFNVENNAKIGDIILSVSGRTFIGAGTYQNISITGMSTTEPTPISPIFSAQLGGENVISRYAVTVTVNNKIGADKYENFKVEYKEFYGTTQTGTTKTKDITGVISGNLNTLTDYITPSNSAYTIRDVSISSYKINGSGYTIAKPPRSTGNTMIGMVFGKANGGIAYANNPTSPSGSWYHIITEINGATPQTGPDNFKIRSWSSNTSGDSSSLGLGIKRTDSIGEFTYTISEGITVNDNVGGYINNIETDISDSISLSNIPPLTFNLNGNDKQVFAPKYDNVNFYLVNTGNSIFFKNNDTGYPIYNTATTATGATCLMRNGIPTTWTSITNSITSTGGYTYSPSQTKFIVGVYTSYDPNDTGTGSNRRVKSRLIKIYRNYEIEYIGD